jgi:hypothetical protein
VGSQFPSYPTGRLTPSLARPKAGVIQQVASSVAPARMTTGARNRHYWVVPS